MKELDHQPSEALECTGNAHGGANFDENAFRRVDVYLELSGFVDGRIEEGKEALLFVSRDEYSRAQLAWKIRVQT